MSRAYINPTQFLHATLETQFPGLTFGAQYKTLNKLFYLHALLERAQKEKADAIAKATQEEITRIEDTLSSLLFIPNIQRLVTEKINELSEQQRNIMAADEPDFDKAEALAKEINRLQSLSSKEGDRSAFQLSVSKNFLAMHGEYRILENTSSLDDETIAAFATQKKEFLNFLIRTCRPAFPQRYFISREAMGEKAAEVSVGGAGVSFPSSEENKDAIEFAHTFHQARCGTFLAMSAPVPAYVQGRGHAENEATKQALDTKIRKAFFALLRRHNIASILSLGIDSTRLQYAQDYADDNFSVRAIKRPDTNFTDIAVTETVDDRIIEHTVRCYQAGVDDNNPISLDLFSELEQLIDLHQQHVAGTNIGIHCFSGVGRTGAALALMLMLTHCLQNPLLMPTLNILLNSILDGSANLENHATQEALEFILRGAVAILSEIRKTRFLVQEAIQLFKLPEVLLQLVCAMRQMPEPGTKRNYDDVNKVRAFFGIPELANVRTNAARLQDDPTAEKPTITVVTPATTISAVSSVHTDADLRFHFGEQVPHVHSRSSSRDPNSSIPELITTTSQQGSPVSSFRIPPTLTPPEGTINPPAHPLEQSRPSEPVPNSDASQSEPRKFSLASSQHGLLAPPPSQASNTSSVQKPVAPQNTPVDLPLRHVRTPSPH